MACRGCSKSGLGLLARSPPPTSSRASFLETTTNLARTVSSSNARPVISQKQQQRSPRYRGFHSSAKRPAAAENKVTNVSKEPESTPVGGLAKLLKRTVGTNNTYAVYGVTESWAKLCAKQADYTISREDRKADKIKTTEEGEEIGISSGGVWHDEFHLLPTFSTWSQVGMLHMYLLAVRFRALDKEAHEKWQKQLVDHFFYLAEAKMDIMHDMGSSSLRQRYLKDLFVQWRGVILAYDEGLVKGDAVLASAVWRNLFKARADVDLRVLAAVVGWMRYCLKVLDRTEDADLPLAVGQLFSKKASAELLLVDDWSRMIEGNVNQDGAGEGGQETVKKSASRFS